MASPLKMGDDILEINGVPIVDQDQEEVGGASYSGWGTIRGWGIIQWVGQPTPLQYSEWG